MNEIVRFGGRVYITSITYPSGDYEFEPVRGAKHWNEIKQFSRMRVEKGIRKGAIRTVFRPKYFQSKKR